MGGRFLILAIWQASLRRLIAGDRLTDLPDRPPSKHLWDSDEFFASVVVSCATCEARRSKIFTLPRS